jgi:hypothetical protein
MGSSRAVAQIPFGSLERIFDHSRVRFTANPFHFAKNGYQKFFNVPSRDFGNNPFILDTQSFSLIGSGWLN